MTDKTFSQHYNNYRDSTQQDESQHSGVNVHSAVFGKMVNSGE